jgi:hypothetical protein
MIPKNLEVITELDLRLLIENKIQEGKAIEYKLRLPDNSDAGRREFLKDISSFANTAGGDVLYGVEARSGLPVALPGILVESQDDLRLQLENRLRDGMQPRISDVRFRFILVDGNQHVLLARVPGSWGAPHRVIHSEHGHFYGRNSAGAYQMDVDQLRTSFLQTFDIENRIRDFRGERVIEIAKGRAPVPLDDGALYIFHLVPLSAFATRQILSVPEIRALSNNFAYFDAQNVALRSNLEGMLFFQTREAANSAYTQVFRNGIVESVTVFGPWEGELFLSPTFFERETIKALGRFAKGLAQLDVSPPLFVFISIVKARGYKLWRERGSVAGRDRVLERDELLMPDAVIHDRDFNAGVVLKPVFDIVWNAFNYPGGTENLNEDGEWIGQR